MIKKKSFWQGQLYTHIQMPTSHNLFGEHMWIVSDKGTQKGRLKSYTFDNKEGE